LIADAVTANSKPLGRTISAWSRSNLLLSCPDGLTVTSELPGFCLKELAIREQAPKPASPHRW